MQNAFKIKLNMLLSYFSYSYILVKMDYPFFLQLVKSFVYVFVLCRYLIRRGLKQQNLILLFYG